MLIYLAIGQLHYFPHCDGFESNIIGGYQCFEGFVVFVVARIGSKVEWYWSYLLDSKIPDNNTVDTTPNPMFLCIDVCYVHVCVLVNSTYGGK